MNAYDIIRYLTQSDIILIDISSIILYRYFDICVVYQLGQGFQSY